MSKRSSSDFFKSSSIQSNDERIEASQFSMAIFECEMSARIGEGLTGVMHSGHLWQVGSITSLATETTGRNILVDMAYALFRWSGSCFQFSTRMSPCFTATLRGVPLLTKALQDFLAIAVKRRISYSPLFNVGCINLRHACAQRLQ